MNDQVEIRDKPDDPPRPRSPAMPPGKWAQNKTFHWLRLHDDGRLIIAVFFDKSYGGPSWWAPTWRDAKTVDHCAMNGWSWYSPARPPKQPHRDATERNDNVR